MLDASHLLIFIMATVQCDCTALRPCLPSCAGFAIVMSANEQILLYVNGTYSDYLLKAISGF